MNLNIALNQKDLGDLLAEFCPVRADRGVGSTEFRTDIGSAIIQQRIEFAEVFDDGRPASNARGQFGENQLEFRFAFALVLIILLKKEDEQ
ncbi:hypothetical protein, partial [Mesorhizobium sp.]|uniref:hypothetical protein n=1 Tax=Mesorhizobium sp. TaxID=1871066 RepID=UPI00257D43C0